MHIFKMNCSPNCQDPFKWYSLRLLPVCFFFAFLVLIGCGPRRLTIQERKTVEEYLPMQAEKLIRLKNLPNQAPMTSLELVRAVFSDHPLLKSRLPVPMTPGELIATSIRRPGKGEVGDLVTFKQLNRTLDYAVVFKVHSKTRYTAVGILLGEVKAIEIDLATPQARRKGTEVINSVIRSIAKSDQPPHLYLAGALFSEFRSLF